MTRQRISGWGRTAWTTADVVTAENATELARLVSASHRRGAIARGLGRAYGAAAQNAGGTVITCAHDDGSTQIQLDVATGVVTAPAGISLDTLLRVCVPKGWFVPVTPGTRFITLGGAVASDVHGKNHHVDGSFGQHVVSIKVLLSSGQEVILSPTENASWFWATVGGMGLTGIVTEVTFRMLQVESSQVMVETRRLAHLDDVIGAMSDSSDDDFRYSVAWVDTMATKGSLGRSVLSTGDHATREDVKVKGDPLGYEPSQRLTAPGFVPSGVLNKWSVRAFNEAWFRKAPRKAKRGTESITHFFPPLDGVAEWNRIYGRNGFIQYQVVVPDAHASTVPWMIETFASRQVPVFLAVLKRLGAENGGMLSFPSAGWTLAVDIPAGVEGVAGILDEMDERVVDEGGRIYLAKDSRMNPRHLASMYPRLNEFRSVRDEVDPSRRFVSNLSQRLGL